MDSVRVGWANHFRRETSSITRSPAPESVMLDEHQHSAHQATHGHNHRYPARTQLDLNNNSAKTLQSAKIKRHMLNVTRRTVTRQKHSIEKNSGSQKHAALVGSHCSQLQESESAGKRGVALRTAERKAGLFSNEFECRFLKKSGKISKKCRM